MPRINKLEFKLQLIWWTLGLVFNSRNGCTNGVRLCWYEAKLSCLMLKTRPKQLLGYHPIDIALTVRLFYPSKP